MPLDKIIFYLKRLYRDYTKKYLNRIFIALALSVVVALSTSATAYLLDPAIKKIFIDQDKTYAILVPILIIVAFSSKGISLYTARSLLIVLGHRIQQKVLNEMTTSLLLFDVETTEAKHSGKFLAHFLYDVGLIQALVSTGILNIMKDSITLVALVSLMFYQNWKLALFSLIMMPMAVFVAKSLGKRMGKATVASAESTGSFTTILSEILKGTKIIKIYQKEKHEGKKAEIAIKDLTDKNIKMSKILIRATPVMEILTGIMIAGFIYFSGFLIARGEIGINNFFSFLAAMMLAYQPIRSLATINMTVYQGTAAADRVFGLIDKKNKIKNNENYFDLKITKSNLDFKNVSFQYGSGKVAAIKNINLNMEGGKVTALVGHSGAGKSTILNLIPRFYDPQSGKILIDNQSIKDVSLSSLRKNISLVSQDVILFDDTVENNIKYAKLNATKDEIINACKLAAADEFIENLPSKYNTLIGENGTRLSGGEKQRLSIARAILKNSPFVLLDEATSSLDSESEAKVQNAIFNLTQNRTTLVIAHRFSTINKADKIVLLNRGNIVATGTHDELLKNSKEYKNLYQRQIAN
jgi:subfamily B ATP-binding cassette protein MsbA